MVVIQMLTPCVEALPIFFSIKLNSARFSLENCSLMVNKYQDKCIKFHESVNGFAVFGEKRCAATQYIRTEKEIHV